MDSPSDEQLFADFREGRPEAFELLVRRHSAELYRFVLRFTSSTISAEDVVQDAFLQAYLSASTFESGRRFKPWLFTIAANKARDWLRKKRRAIELPIDAEVDGCDGNRTYAELLSSVDESVEETSSLEDQRRRVRSIVDSLPDPFREVLVLSYYHRFAYRDIAEVLGVPIGTVKSRLHSAVGRFRTAYLDSFDAEFKND